MRYLPLLAIAVSSFAFANTPGDFVGKNKHGLTFSINMDSSNIEVKDGDEIWKPRYISAYQVRTKGKYLIPFNERQLPSNCTIPRRSNRVEFEFISCHEHKGTPLSNVRYELKIESVNCCK